MTNEWKPRTEAQLVETAIQWIKDLDVGAWARKVHGSRFQAAGEPDIDACIASRAVKLECKLPGHVPTPVQMAAMRRWEKVGALAGWFDTMDGLLKLIARYDDRTWINPQLCQHRKHTEEGHPMCQRCGDGLVWT